VKDEKIRAHACHGEKRGDFSNRVRRDDRAGGPHAGRRGAVAGRANRGTRNACPRCFRAAGGLIVIKGDVRKAPRDIRNITAVFRRGIGYDSATLTEAVRGLVGMR
jgi:hypothetical protein